MLYSNRNELSQDNDFLADSIIHGLAHQEHGLVREHLAHFPSSILSASNAAKVRVNICFILDNVLLELLGSPENASVTNQSLGINFLNELAHRFQDFITYKYGDVCSASDITQSVLNNFNSFLRRGNTYNCAGWLLSSDKESGDLIATNVIR